MTSIKSRIEIPTRDDLLKMSSEGDRYNRLLTFLVLDKLNDEDASRVVNLILTTCGSRHMLRTLAAWIEHYRACAHYLDWLYVLVQCLPKPSYHMFFCCKTVKEMDVYVELGYDPWKGIGNWRSAGETLLSCFLSEECVRFECVCYLISVADDEELDIVAYDSMLTNMIGEDNAGALTLWMCNFGYGGIGNNLLDIMVSERILEGAISDTSIAKALKFLTCRKWILYKISVEQTLVVDMILESFC